MAAPPRPVRRAQVLLSTYERRRSQREVVNEMPLYPTETLLWDESQVGVVVCVVVVVVVRWCGGVWGAVGGQEAAGLPGARMHLGCIQAYEQQRVLNSCFAQRKSWTKRCGRPTPAVPCLSVWYTTTVACACAPRVQLVAVADVCRCPACPAPVCAPACLPAAQIPASSEHYTGEGCLALPKLNLQFLTTHDYLLRNFHLFRCAERRGRGRVGAGRTPHATALALAWLHTSSPAMASLCTLGFGVLHRCTACWHVLHARGGGCLPAGGPCCTTFKLGQPCCSTPPCLPARPDDATRPPSS